MDGQLMMFFFSYFFLTMQIEDGSSTIVELVNNLNSALKRF
jgi:hypothetical protein